MINSGINKVGVLTQYSYRSLMDHIGSGKEWDLDRRRGGLFLFPPYLSGDHSGWYKGSADGCIIIQHSCVEVMMNSF